MRVLIVEDEVRLAATLQDLMEMDGYTADTCHDGETGLDNALTGIYDVMILDVMLPKMDGFTVLRRLRAGGVSTPVLMLTARSEVTDKVTGLDLGAIDYLVKPFSFEELMARVRALTRRTAVSNTPVYTLCDLTLDSGSHTVTRAGQEIKLSAKEFALLEYLLRNQGRVLSRENIENNLWNFDYEGGTNAVDVYIRYLRRKIDEDFSPKLIHTVRGVGYVLKKAQD